MSPKTMRYWRCRLGLLAYLIMIAAATFSATLTVLLAEAVLERLAAAGDVGGAVPFAIAIAVVGVFVLLRSSFGRGALTGSRLRVPPTWLSAALAVLIFWVWLWLIGPEPYRPVHFTLKAALQRADAIFTHGWVWFWGAAISGVIASVVWQAGLVRLLAWRSKHLGSANWLGRELTPLPVNDASPRADAMRRQQQETMEAILQGNPAASGAGAAAPSADTSRVLAQGGANGQSADGAANVSDTLTLPQDGPTDNEIDRWLQRNDEPLQPGERDLFAVVPSPRRVLVSLRPTHQYGNARTMALIGQRGGGKSSLLRLAEGLPEARSEVELRFVYLSLWEFETAQAAIQAAIKDVLRVVRDRIDIFPFTGAAGAFARAMAGDGRYRSLSEAFGLRTSSKELFDALSTILLFNKLRVIICIEDDDRREDAVQKNRLVNLITGSIDFIRQFPGFGYVLCISSEDWSQLQQAALNEVEPPEKQHARREDIQRVLAKKLPDGTDAKPQEHKDAMRNHIYNEIQILQRAAEIAAKKQLREFDTTRLCREELVIPALGPEQWWPVLKTVRERMFQHAGQEPGGKCFGLTAHYASGQKNASGPYANGRQLMWRKLTKKLASCPFTLGRPMPEFGLANAQESGFSFTPRSLRRGLGDAWRKWLAIQADPSKYIRLIDPDSVLVACLVRACRPDVWNILIRDESLLLGGNWPVTDYLVQQEINKTYSKQFTLAHPYDKDLLSYGENYPHLGLSQEIINVMRKSCNVSDLPESPVTTTDKPEQSADGTAQATSIHRVEITIIRQGGLIGTLPDESDPGSNWRLFLNA